MVKLPVRPMVRKSSQVGAANSTTIMDDLTHGARPILQLLLQRKPTSTFLVVTLDPIRPPVKLLLTAIIALVVGTILKLPVRRSNHPRLPVLMVVQC